MTAKSFVKVTYDSTLDEKRDISDVIDFVDPVEVPFLAMVNGGGDMDPNMRLAAIESRKGEWEEKKLRPATTLLTAAIDASETTLGVTATDGLHLTKGTILLIGSEQFLVATAGTSAGVVVVATRPQGGTTAATHALGATVTIIGRAHEEGKDANTDSYTNPTQPYNWAQEFVETIGASDIEKGIKRFGSLVEYLGGGKKDVTNVIKMLVMESQIKNLINVELQLIYGKRVEMASGIPARFGGVLEFMDSANKVDLNGASLTIKDMADLMETIFGKTGGKSMPDVAMTNYRGARILTALYGNTVSPTTVKEGKYGGLAVTTITTEGGDLDIIKNVRYPNRIDLLRSDCIEVVPVEDNQFTSVPLGRKGTYEEWMQSGSYTAIVRKSVCHGSLSNWDTTLPL